MRLMLMSRCSFEKPSSDDRCFAHHVAVKQRDGTAAHLHQLDHQRVGDGRLARAGKPGEEHGKALFVARRRGAAQLRTTSGKLNHSGISRPSRRRRRSSVPEMSRMVAPLRPRRGFVLRAFLNIDHLFEIDHLDADFDLVFAEQFLRGIGS